MNRRSSGRRAVVRPPWRVTDAVVLGLAVAVALLPLLPVYGARAAVPAVAGGVLLGAGTALVAARRRWGVLVTCAVVLVVYLVAGAALAAPTTALGGFLPTPASVVALSGAIISVWREVLTLDPELGASADVLAAPFLLGLAGAATAVSLALRTGRRAGAWAAVVPIGVLGVAVLLGTRQTVHPLAAGAILALLLVGWAAWRVDGVARRRVIALAVMAAAVVGGGFVGGPLIVDPPRYVLRDEVVPPFDPRDHPSPLSAFRSFVKYWKDTPLLTVQGLPEGAHVRLATMDAYDGVVWNVAGSEQTEGSGSFRRVGETIATSAAGARARVEFEVHDLPMVWLPTVGYAERFTFTGADRLDLASRLRYNDATGTAVLTDGVPAGATWTVDVVVPPQPDDEALATAVPGTVRLPRATGVPDAVPIYAGDLAGTATSPALIARSLQAGLAERGWFSHGVTDADYPSLSGHGADRITTLLSGELMVGDGEQYASAMALMAREMGLPSRVVLGFIPDTDPEADPDAAGQELTITGDDIQAWVEIQFAGHGWVTYYPTPDESRTPREDTLEDQAQDDPQVRQPPPPLPDPEEAPDDDTEQAQTQDPQEETDAEDRWGDVLLVAGAVGVPLILLLAPALLIGLAKRRRRRRRHTAGDTVTRVVGGWDELLDEARDLRRPAPTHATRRETAVHLADAFADRPGRGSRARGRRAPVLGSTVAGLAASADAAVFGRGQPQQENVDLFWKQVEVVRTALRSALPRWHRWRAWYSTASLRARRRARRNARSSSHRAAPGG